MAQVRITNENLWTMDFSERERKSFLGSLDRKLSSKRPSKTQNMSAASVWMTDVSGTDRRSVKAQLMRRGDYRPFWWEVSSQLIQILAPRATLEERMFCFHSFHHRLTFFRLQIIKDFQEIVNSIIHQGILAGLLCAVDQVKRSGQDKP